ncbi:hypothetical protein DFJ73DRAFT_262392, partial [Zopfochytrium polystomum]
LIAGQYKNAPRGSTPTRPIPTKKKSHTLYPALSPITQSFSKETKSQRNHQKKKKKKMHPLAQPTLAVPIAPTKDGAHRFLASLPLEASDRAVKPATPTHQTAAAAGLSSDSLHVPASASSSASVRSGTSRSSKSLHATERLEGSSAASHVDADGVAESSRAGSPATDGRAARFERLMDSLAYGASDRHIHPLR